MIDGYYHGIAIGSFIEGSATGPKEEVRLVLETGGALSVYMGSSSVGQGLETIMAQIAADAMEMPYHKITILHGSTAYVKDGYGAYHSRSTVMGGSAILVGAEKLKELIQKTAAERLGCKPEDVAIDDEQASFGGSHLSFAELSETPLEVEGCVFQQEIYLGLRHAGGARRGRSLHRPRQGHRRHVGRGRRPHDQSADLARPGNRFDGARSWRRVPGASGLRR